MREPSIVAVPKVDHERVCIKAYVNSCRFRHPSSNAVHNCRALEVGDVPSNQIYATSPRLPHQLHCVPRDYPMCRNTSTINYKLTSFPKKFPRSITSTTKATRPHHITFILAPNRPASTFQTTTKHFIQNGFRQRQSQPSHGDCSGQKFSSQGRRGQE